MMGLRDSEIYRLEPFSEEDCWLLLSRMSLRGRNEVQFEEVGRKIAKKCYGSPFLVQTMGNILRFKRSLEEWNYVLSEMLEIIPFEYLTMKYNELSPAHKRCFSYCAVFPEKTKIFVENLIESWIALGYLGPDVEGVEVKGRECYDNLVNKSLLQDLEEDDEIHSCKMDDKTHDFVTSLWVKRVKEARTNKSTTCRVCNRLQVSTVNEFYTLHCDNGTTLILCECLTRLRVLSVTNCDLQSIPQEMEHLNHLRYLNMIGITKISREGLKIIFQLYNLHSLNLRRCGLKEIPMEIGNLIGFRRLDLSWNESLKELPVEIGNLTDLRSLNLKRNKSLKELPREIGKLIRLVRLDLSWNESLKELPMEIGNLTDLIELNLNGDTSLEELPESICDLRELQTLNILGCTRVCRLPEGVAGLTGLRTLNEFRGGSGCNKFGLLKNLNGLGGVLWLRIRLDGDIELEDLVDDARSAELSCKIHIEKLRIYFEKSPSSSSSSSVSRNVIDALHPHSNLSELSIWYYGSSKLPAWMLSPLDRIRNLNLHFCKHLTSLPPLGKLPCLEELCIDLMEALETVRREFLGITTIEGRRKASFPKLKTLEFRDCGKWKEWEDITAEEAEDFRVMPYLTELTITGCNGLKVLPHCLLRKASSLEKLRISGSTQLLQRYQNEDGFDWESISRINPRLQLICYS